jgi:tRNA dimethylallyltransferase
LKSQRNLNVDVNIPIITGPTGVGKSDAVYSLKNIHDYEVISADAFQVYIGFDIGTAKPGKDILGSIPHHLINIMPPSGAYNVGKFIEETERAIKDILERGRIPIIVGGTGLYIKALVNGIFEAPPIEPSLRAALMNTPQALLYKELLAVDPNAAGRVHPSDKIRTVRALEVYKTALTPISDAWKINKTTPLYSYNIIIIEKQRELLYKDIDDRTNLMFENGFVSEVKELLASGVSMDAPAFRAIGYRETAKYIMGESTYDDTVKLTAQRTRQFAKRQLTLFRGMKDAKRILPNELETILI